MFPVVDGLRSIEFGSPGKSRENLINFIINGNKSIEEIHTAIITRVSEIAALKRNAVEDKGNLLLRPIRAAGKEVKKIGNTASNAVKSRSNSSKSVKAKPTKKKPAAKK